MSDKPKKPTIAELQAILKDETEKPIEILPNGEIRAQKRRRGRPQKVKVLTMKEALGGEYAA